MNIPTRSILLCFLFLNILCFTNAQIPTEGLVAYFPFNGNAIDESANSNDGYILGPTLGTDRLGNAESAFVFDGIDDYMQVPDSDNFSIPTTDSLTISVWMRSDALDFPKHDKDYVHWMGKGVTGKHEWVFRIYNLDSARPNRTSCYSYNLSGGLGAGSYVQENVSIGEWIHLVAIYDFPSNSIKLYKNGILKGDNTFSGYNITPGNGTEPLRIGTRDFKSFYKGAIDDLRFYDRVLTEEEILSLYQEGGWEPTTKTFTVNDLTILNLYPNPTSQFLSIEFSDKTKNIEIINSNGKRVYSKNVTFNSKNLDVIDVSDFDKGIYYLKTQMKSEMVVRKFIKY